MSRRRNPKKQPGCLAYLIATVVVLMQVMLGC